MKYILTVFLSFVSVLGGFAAEIPVSVMQRIYQEVRTPYKYGMVVAPTSITVRTARMDEAMRRGWQKVTTCYTGRRRDASFRIRMTVGI